MTRAGHGKRGNGAMQFGCDLFGQSGFSARESAQGAATSAKLSQSFLRVGALARIHGSGWRHGASPAPGGPSADERASPHPPTASPLRCVASPPPDTEARLRRDTELHGKARGKSQSGLTSSACDFPHAKIPCSRVALNRLCGLCAGLFCPRLRPLAHILSRLWRC